MQPSDKKDENNIENFVMWLIFSLDLCVYGCKQWMNYILSIYRLSSP